MEDNTAVLLKNKSVLNQNKLPEKVSFWLEDKIYNYLYSGFGTKNKNDFEVLFFRALLEDEDFYKKSDFEKCKTLHITESKLKKLKYEADLLYNPLQVDLEEKLIHALKTATFKGNSALLQFVVRDRYLKFYFEDLLYKAGRFPDSSFNSNIVIIDFKDLITIYNSFEKGQDSLKELLIYAHDNFNPNITISDLFQGITNCIDGNSQGLISAGVGVVTNGIKMIMQKIDRNQFIKSLDKEITK